MTPTEKVVAIGDDFNSKRERARFDELQLLERAGKIKELRRRVRFVLIKDWPDERGVAYVADFVYEEHNDDGLWCRPGVGWTHWSRIVEDCTGCRTEAYELKKKLMRHVHQVRIRETS
jgi:Protein of unknown function (DUF1064)